MSDSFNPIKCRTPGFPILHYLLEFAKTHVHWVGDAIQPSYPLSSPSPPALNHAQHQDLFQRVGSPHQVASFSFSISLSNEYSGLISFRIDWFDLLFVQGLSRVFTSTTVQKHQFFDAQPSLWSTSHIHYMTTGKTTALTIWTFVSKVMFLLFNMVSKFVIASLPSRKCHLISDCSHCPQCFWSPRK